MSAAIGQLSKPFTSVLLYGKDLDIRATVQAGGFPSTHSSVLPCLPLINNLYINVLIFIYLVITIGEFNIFYLIKFLCLLTDRQWWLPRQPLAWKGKQHCFLFISGLCISLSCHVRIDSIFAMSGCCLLRSNSVFPMF